MKAHLALMAAAVLSTAAEAAPPPAATIVLDKMAFGPVPKGLHVGQAVIFVNRDILQHSATDKAGGFDVLLKPGARGRAVLTKPGRITVYCRYHPDMTLVLDVAK